MKKVIISIISCLVGFTAFAQDFTFRDFEYRVLDPEKRTCQLIGPSSEEIEGDVEIREYVMYEEESYQVTSIRHRAFWECQNITSINLPNSIEEIGEWAFHKCTSLVSLSLPNAITSIPEDMCDNCASLQSILIPESVVTIGDCAFSGCSSLKSISLPENLESIKWDAFQGCTSLTSLTLPDSLTEIGHAAFASCLSLEKLELPETLKVLGENAFSFCDKLSSVFIPASVVEIGSSPFAGCDSLIAINVDDNNPNYDSLDGLLYTKNLEKLIQFPAGLSSVNLPEGLIKIGPSAFSYFNNLREITLPSSVKEIGSSAFVKCEALQTVNLPPSLEFIDSYVFYSCDSLKSIVIPQLVTNLKTYTFGWCEGLEEVTLLSPNFVEVPDGGDRNDAIYESVFYGCSTKMTLYVYQDLIKDYKNSYWWTLFFKKILPIAGGSGVDSLPLDETKPFDIYSLSGMLVKEKAVKEDLRNLTPALYILRQGTSSKKVQIR